MLPLILGPRIENADFSDKQRKTRRVRVLELHILMHAFSSNSLCVLKSC